MAIHDVMFVSYTLESISNNTIYFLINVINTDIKITLVEEVSYSQMQRIENFVTEG